MLGPGPCLHFVRVFQGVVLLVGVLLHYQILQLHLLLKIVDIQLIQIEQRYFQFVVIIAPLLLLQPPVTVHIVLLLKCYLLRTWNH